MKSIPGKNRRAAIQLEMPGVAELQTSGESISIRNRKIPHSKILLALEKSAGESCSVVELYRSEVLPGKTRTIRLLGKKSSAVIRNTLLGFEVQASYKRIHCPDMATARYLKLFTELGCHTVKLPYDPTVTARLIPRIEAGAAQISAGVRGLFPHNEALQRYVLRKIYEIIRKELKRGEGTASSASFTSREEDLS